MVKLTIDRMHVEVPDGTTVMEAACALGISIPSMCFLPGFSNHPSCMVCMVKHGDHLVPSCAMPVSEGMAILTDTTEVKEARREALELLLSDHAGDCEAPCRMACPAFMDIPLMNRLLASGNFIEALKIVREEIAIPLILGYICAAPCEKACKRKPIDQTVSICLLKRSAALHGSMKSDHLPLLPAKNGKRVAIIGTGPAGLSTAFYLLRSGHACVLYDRHEQAGGAMRYDIQEDQLPGEILDLEIGVIRNMGAEFCLGKSITGEIFQTVILSAFDAVVLATGSMKSNPPDHFGLEQVAPGSFADNHSFTTSLPGVFACGSMVREQKMAVQSAAQGKKTAKQVERYLKTSLPERSQPGFNSTIGRLSETEWAEYLKESIPDGQTTPTDGKPAGFTREEAMHEALRCLHCDCRKPLSCKLRMYAAEYQVNRRKFSGAERSQLTKSMQHETVIFETEKCIRCGLCIDIAEKHGESIGLAYAGRGFDVRISVPFSETIREALTTAAGACVTACPTGALAYKSMEERLSP